MYDVITVGSATVDVFAYTDKSEVVKIKGIAGEEDFIAYPSGSKILIKTLLFSFGGGGTNSAVTFKNMGSRVAYIGKIGSDENGSQILNFLKKRGIDFLGSVGGGASGYSLVLDSIEHERTILVHKGVNNNLGFSELNLKRLNTKWFYFSSMMGESFKTLEKLADFAKKRKVKVAFNPSSYLIEKGYRYLKKVLEKTDVLMMNKEEAMMLVGKDEICELLKKLKKIGAEIVIITNGKDGAHVFDGKKCYFAETHKIKVIETTGTGDAFSSAFVASLIKNKGIEYSLQVAMANAESTLKHHGAKNGLLSWGEAQKIIKRNPCGISVERI
jgi:sugar/nucleoside kinase (ribokinase family)